MVLFVLNPKNSSSSSGGGGDGGGCGGSSSSSSSSSSSNVKITSRNHFFDLDFKDLRFSKWKVEST